jgi:hypothetical protein
LSIAFEYVCTTENDSTEIPTLLACPQSEQGFTVIIKHVQFLSDKIPVRDEKKITDTVIKKKV